MCRVVTFDSFFTVISLSAHKHIVIVSNWKTVTFFHVFSCFFTCVFFTLFHTKYLEKNNNFEFRKWSTGKTNNLTCPSGLPYLEEVAAPNCISTLLNINLKKTCSSHFLCCAARSQVQLLSVSTLNSFFMRLNKNA